MKTTCRAHCRTCGRHFSGVTAFDVHRIGRFDVPKDDENARRCESPFDLKGLAKEVGECRVSERETLGGVEVWFQPQNRVQAQEAFSASAITANQ